MLIGKSQGLDLQVDGLNFHQVLVAAVDLQLMAGRVIR